MARFNGKVVLVTGGASGIGKAAALSFAAEGASVVIADARRSEGDVTARLIKQGNGRALCIETDVGRPADCQKMVETAVAEFGRVDIAFNCAGVVAAGLLAADESEDEWDRIVDINLKGVFLSMKYEIPIMLKGGGGSIVNVSSIAGVQGEPLAGSYTASKHGVIGLSRSAAIEYARLGVRINVICPGGTLTPMLKERLDQDPAGLKAVIERHPVGRLAEPQEIANAALFLASNEASFIVGAVLAVDGGLTI